MKFAENGEALVGGTADGLLYVPLDFYHTLSYTKRRPLPDGISAWPAALCARCTSSTRQCEYAVPCGRLVHFFGSACANVTMPPT